MAKYFVANVFTFNNYYNRILKRYDTLVEYVENAGLWDELHNVNFNPNDGITTTFIWGKGEGAPFINASFDNHDYFILSTLDTEAPEGEQEKIISRWFIIESVRTRGGQEKLTLRRDVLADEYSTLLRSPLYIERGMISSSHSPLLLNNESVTVNQIKTKEILLKDASDCPWLIIYLKKGVLGGNHQVTVDTDTGTVVYKTLTTPIDQWEYYDYINNDFKGTESSSYKIIWNANLTASAPFLHKQTTFGDEGYDWSQYFETIIKSGLKSIANIQGQPMYDVAQPYITSLNTLFYTSYGYKSKAQLDAFLEYKDKLIKDSNGKIFKVIFELKSNDNVVEHKITKSGELSMFNIMDSIWNGTTGQSVSGTLDCYYAIANGVSVYRIRLEEQPQIQGGIDFQEYQGSGTDSPLYDVICMPYGECKTRTVDSDNTQHDFDNSVANSFKIMNAITRGLTSQYVLDYQLLPYCPLINELGLGRVTMGMAEYNGVYVTQGGTLLSYVFVVSNITFTFDLPTGIFINVDHADARYRMKYLNDCTMIRLCSPNYNGVFEMNIAKNGGQIYSFNIDVTLRPINPYIHINPEFSKLYGQDFNDQRGLVCGGDFSLGLVDDAWTVYEIQNKNYQNIFDRQIVNLDINNSIARQEAIWGAIAGTAQGGATGGAGGGMVGGPYGAAAGALAGTFIAGLGGAIDLGNLVKRQQEQRSFMTDNYNFALGNVRALPNSITRTSAITANNKLFPFVEIYECTKQEREAYFNKIKYNGMTVGIIDQITNYISPDNSNYFRGKIIRFPNGSSDFYGYNFVEDYHFAEIMNEELMKGVFI